MTTTSLRPFVGSFALAATMALATHGCGGPAASQPPPIDPGARTPVLGPTATTEPPPAATPTTTAAPTEYRGLGAESVAPELIARFAAPALAPGRSATIQQMMD